MKTTEVVFCLLFRKNSDIIMVGIIWYNSVQYQTLDLSRFNRGPLSRPDNTEWAIGTTWAPIRPQQYRNVLPYLYIRCVDWKKVISNLIERTITNRMVAPHMVCGLKYQLDIIRECETLSHPSRVRGLKYASVFPFIGRYRGKDD